MRGRDSEPAEDEAGAAAQRRRGRRRRRRRSRARSGRRRGPRRRARHVGWRARPRRAARRATRGASSSLPSECGCPARSRGENKAQRMVCAPPPPGCRPGEARPLVLSGLAVTSPPPPPFFCGCAAAAAFDAGIPVEKRDTTPICRRIDTCDKFCKRAAPHKKSGSIAAQHKGLRAQAMAPCLRGRVATVYFARALAVAARRRRARPRRANNLTACGPWRRDRRRDGAQAAA